MHGGDIYRNKIEYDFSVNVNPLGLHPSIKKAYMDSLDKVCNYPDPSCQKLRHNLARALADKYGAKDAKELEEKLVLGNGASELILALARAKEIKKALLLAPSFTGYETALEAVGAKRSYFYLKKENAFAFASKEVDAYIKQLEQEKADLCILTNPNNPNGGLIGRDDLERIARACREHGSLLMIDECFMELTGKAKEGSFLSCLSKEHSNVIILRAFTKSFAIPGLRLGYALTGTTKFCQDMGKQLSEWNVSVVAQEVGLAALGQLQHLKDAQALIAGERNYLTEGLIKLGFEVYPSEANYILFYDDFTHKRKKKLEYREEEVSLMEFLLRHKILIRDCRDYEGLGVGFYRIAVRSHEENTILLERMMAWRP